MPLPQPRCPHDLRKVGLLPPISKMVPRSLSSLPPNPSPQLPRSLWAVLIQALSCMDILPLPPAQMCWSQPPCSLGLISAPAWAALCQPFPRAPDCLLKDGSTLESLLDSKSPQIPTHLSPLKKRVAPTLW